MAETLSGKVALVTGGSSGIGRARFVHTQGNNGGSIPESHQSSSLSCNSVFRTPPFGIWGAW